MTKNTYRITALLALTATLALSGCTFRIADPTASRDEEKPNSSTSRETEAPEKTDDETAVSTARQDALDAVTATVPCSPGLVLSQVGAVIRIDGECDDVTITGDASVVITDDVDLLRIDATGVSVYSLAVGSLAITGDANVVYWTGSTPSVDDSGVANTYGKDA